MTDPEVPDDPFEYDDVDLAQVHGDAGVLDALADGRSADRPEGIQGGIGDGLAALLTLREVIDQEHAAGRQVRSAVEADAIALDALAAGGEGTTRGTQALAALRNDLDAPSIARGAPEAKPGVTEPAAAGLAGPAVTELAGARARRRRRALVAAAVGAVVVFGGTGVAAAATEAQPGQTLYGLRVVLIGRTSDDPRGQPGRARSGRVHPCFCAARSGGRSGKPRQHRDVAGPGRPHSAYGERSASATASGAAAAGPAERVRSDPRDREPDTRRAREAEADHVRIGHAHADGNPQAIDHLAHLDRRVARTQPGSEAAP